MARHYYRPAPEKKSLFYSVLLLVILLIILYTIFALKNYPIADNLFFFKTENSSLERKNLSVEEQEIKSRKLEADISEERTILTNEKLEKKKKLLLENN